MLWKPCVILGIDAYTWYQTRHGIYSLHGGHCLTLFPSDLRSPNKVILEQEWMMSGEDHHPRAHYTVSNTTFRPWVVLLCDLKGSNTWSQPPIRKPVCGSWLFLKQETLSNGLGCCWNPLYVLSEGKWMAVPKRQCHNPMTSTAFSSGQWTPQCMPQRMSLSQSQDPGLWSPARMLLALAVPCLTLGSQILPIPGGGRE